MLLGGMKGWMIKNYQSKIEKKNTWRSNKHYQAKLKVNQAEEKANTNHTDNSINIKRNALRHS